MAPSDPKTILILGGSYAALSTSHHLLKHCLPSLPPYSHRVVLVSAASEAMCRQACPRALIADHFFDQSKLFVSIPAQFEQYGDLFEFVHGRAVRVWHEERRVDVVKSNGGGGEEVSLGYHALVIATGSSTPSPLLGPCQSDTEQLREHWKVFRAALPSATHILIGGGGPAGVEVAAELGEYLNGRGKKEPNVRITLVTSGGKILPVLRDTIAAKAEAQLGKVGVAVVKGTRVEGVEPYNAGLEGGITEKASVRLSDGRELSADLYIPAVGTKANAQFLDAELLAEDGRVDTNKETLRVDKAGARVYAVGDCASCSRAAVHLVLNAIPVVGHNIKRDLLADTYGEKVVRGEDRVYKEDTRETQLVPLGRSKGVGAFMGYAMPSFVVWASKGRDYWLWTVGRIWSGRQWAKES